MKASTGLRNGLLATSSVKSQLDNGFLNIYAGTIPADADAAIGSATLLCTISNNSAGTGIHFAAAAAGGTLSKLSSEVWSGVNTSAGGTATFYRHVGPSDTGASSTTEPRMQGTVDVSGADLNLVAGTTFTAGVTTTINAYAVGEPTN